jgi:hypothetical protein
MLSNMRSLGKLLVKKFDFLRRFIDEGSILVTDR